ncbi:DNA polymerase ligase-domain-containing protein [Xylariales sp. AK1849]|nr:DNA polymerase ligase-domain-containing protein [Xylariales sp. AK1849]
MPSKRGHSPGLVPNPFIKKRNLAWSIELTGSSLDAETDSSQEDGHSVQHPLAEPHPKAARGPSREAETDSSRDMDAEQTIPGPDEGHQPNPAAVEAGEAHVEDHLAYFTGILAKATRAPFPAGMPHLAIPAYRRLYETNTENPGGAHFVIHQHDHPIAGTHYDLRLQINATSSASWAIMYGLPGDPNSQRLNRNATETRVHCLWNHLIETASASTGSMLIWDTGTYQVLSRRSKSAPAEDPDSQQALHDEDGDVDETTEQQKLHKAFEGRKIKIRLNGTRLPTNYVLYLRLTREEDAAGRAKIGRKPTRRRRRGGFGAKSKVRRPMTSSDSESGGNDDNDETVHAPAEADQEGISAMEREIRELEDEEVRRTNAYIGASNTIGSVHQRKWFVSLDREACGFVRRRKEARIFWDRDRQQGLGKDGDDDDDDDEEEGRLTFPFYVRGVEVEASVVTGRQGADVLRDEGVVGYVRRKGWMPVLN